MMMKYSRMKLETGEARIDPLLSGIAWVRKPIGGRIHEAMVDAGSTGGGRHLSCLPHRNHPGAEARGTVMVHINQWTDWEVPLEGFQELEWLDDPPPRPVTREELLRMLRMANRPHGNLEESLEQVIPENIHTEWGSETE